MTDIPLAESPHRNWVLRGSKSEEFFFRHLIDCIRFRQRHQLWSGDGHEIDYGPDYAHPKTDLRHYPDLRKK